MPPTSVTALLHSLVGPGNPAPGRLLQTLRAQERPLKAATRPDCLPHDSCSQRLSRKHVARS
jgi:hypothetical protein